MFMTDRTYEFFVPATIVTGIGSAKTVGTWAKRLKKARAFVVTDGRLSEVGLTERICDCLRESGVHVVVYDGITTEPTTAQVEKGFQLFQESDCDLLIGLGGGSCIDAAKGIGIMATHTGSLKDYEGWNKITSPILDIIAIPTTAGTGSEVSRAAIITDTDRRVKMVISSPLLIPKIAIEDPEMTLRLPPSMTAYSGFDALAHAIEGYLSRLTQPLLETMALGAVKLIWENLRQAWANGDNIEARANMMIAQLLAGMTFSNSSTTIGHALARPLGAEFHIPHGLANAIMLPYGLEYTVCAAPEKLARVAEAMGEATAGSSVFVAAEKGVECIRVLRRDIHIPTMSEIGIPRERLLQVARKLAEDGINSGSFGRNPRIPSVEEIVSIYENAYDQG